MRLVDWDEFCTLPNGTVFQEWSLHDLCSLNILGDSNRTEKYEDFTYASLTPACVSTDNGIYPKNWQNSDDHKFLITSPSGYGRDATYNHAGRAWLIWEEADRKRLAAWLLDPVDAASKQNEDDEIYVVPDQFLKKRNP